MDHGAGNLVPIVIWGLFIIVAIRRGMKRMRPAPAAAPTFAKTAAPPSLPPEAPLARRRFTPAPAPRPAAPAATPTMALTLPPEAAAAFPELDLSLPGTPGAPPAGPVRRRIRSLGGGPAFGSGAWARNAIVANEILGPPVSLRPGATLGAPHAF